MPERSIDGEARRANARDDSSDTAPAAPLLVAPDDQVTTPVSAQPRAPRATTAYQPELEGLRGVAMLMVLVFHTQGIVDPFGSSTAGDSVLPLFGPLRTCGDLGVDLFFVLSSYLLSLPFARAATSRAPLAIGRYFGRRALRILPLYYAAVLVGTVASADGVGDLARAVPYLFFLNALPGLTVPLPPFSNVWWSLATEWEFYLVLPIFGVLCRSAVGRRVALAVLAGWLIAYVAWLAGVFGAHSIPGHLTLAFSLFGRAASFIGGGAVAWLSVRRGEAWRARLSRSPWSALIADGALLAVTAVTVCLLDWVLWFGSVQSQALPWHGYHLLQALCCTAVLALIVFTPTHFRALLRTPVLLRLGVLSYSMYIVHLPVLTYGFAALGRIEFRGLGTWTWQSTLAAFALWGVCVALSEGTYRAIERPFLRRQRDLRS